MCARFTLKSSATVLQELFDLDEPPLWEPIYNFAPTLVVPAAIQKEGHRQVRLLRWGLVPSWAKNPSIAQSLINARAETVVEKPAFRVAFRKRRCLIPADGFYEWTTVTPHEEDLFGESKKAGKPYKQPYLFTMADGKPFAMAGLYEYWAEEGMPPIESFAVITSEPNELVAPFHDRMPAIIAKEDFDLWLDTEQNPEKLTALLQPFPSEKMAKHPVSRAMNDPRFEDPSCIEPIAA